MNTPDTLTRESNTYRVWLDAHNRYQDERVRRAAVIVGSCIFFGAALAAVAMVLS
jgi:hypothetical protein